jgi:hypothetical protein
MQNIKNFCGREITRAKIFTKSKKEEEEKAILPL